jgi:transposase
MQVVYERCCGVDVHTKTVVACLITPDAPGQPHQGIRTCGTMTHDLLQVLDWLTIHAWTQVAMESPGVYWRPISNVLAGVVEILVGNAHHLQAVPGRKTDVRAAAWIAELLQPGFLRGSCIPPVAQREFRALTRHRMTLVRDKARLAQRRQPILEGANIKWSGVAAAIVGGSARARIAAVIAGERDPQGLADLARGRLRHKREHLAHALVGRLTPHPACRLSEVLRHLDYLAESSERVNAELERRLQAEMDASERLDSMPGVNRRTAAISSAAMGTAMRRLPSAHQLASWAGMCPGHAARAGQPRSGKPRKGSPWRRQA